jgi:uncharacterized membrane protein YsdA (DUF1294 family)
MSKLLTRILSTFESEISISWNCCGKGGVYLALYYINVIKSAASQYGLRYLAVISAVAAAVTVFDKLSAKTHGRRVPERTLLLLAALGGSASMYAVMLVIRHKTRHIRFMAGIPLIMAVQAVLFVLLFTA